MNKKELEKELKIYKDIANRIGYEYTLKIYCEDCIASNRCHRGCKCPDLIIDMLHELSEGALKNEEA